MLSLVSPVTLVFHRHDSEAMRTADNYNDTLQQIKLKSTPDGVGEENTVLEVIEVVGQIDFDLHERHRQDAGGNSPETEAEAFITRNYAERAKRGPIGGPLVVSSIVNADGSLAIDENNQLVEIRTAMGTANIPLRIKPHIRMVKPDQFGNCGVFRWQIDLEERVL